MEEGAAPTPFDNNKNAKKNNQANTTQTPALDFFSTDLTREAYDNKLDKVI
jgi:ATP-dependent Clp protease ATP-binding subunit ClpA